MRLSREAAVPVILACVFLIGCSSEKSSWLNWKASRPDTPGTAEQLIGTAWDFGPNSVAFDADGKCRLGAKGGILVEMPGTSWSIKNGVVTVTGQNGTLLTATWDGQAFVANGFVGTKAGTEE